RRAAAPSEFRGRPDRGVTTWRSVCPIPQAEDKKRRMFGHTLIAKFDEFLRFFCNVKQVMAIQILLPARDSVWLLLRRPAAIGKSTEQSTIRNIEPEQIKLLWIRKRDGIAQEVICSYVAPITIRNRRVPIRSLGW